MKPRKVIVTIEMETDAPLVELKRISGPNFGHQALQAYWTQVLQVQANVVAPVGAKKRTTRR